MLQEGYTPGRATAAQERELRESIVAGRSFHPLSWGGLQTS